MMKHLTFLAVGALALTACTSENVIDDAASSRNEIRFTNVVNKHTRAVEDLTTGTLRKFNVFGFYTKDTDPETAHEVFSDLTVYDNEGNRQWTYDGPKQYWIPGFTYYFYAYSCGSVDAHTAYGHFDLNMENNGTGMLAGDRLFTIDRFVCDNKHQHDLLYAVADPITASAGSNSDVSFQFSHILSKIKAKFTHNLSSEYEVVIRDVAVTNICNVADFDSKSEAGWSEAERMGGSPFVALLDTENASESREPISLTYGESALTDEAYVIPCKYESRDVYLTFTVDVYYDRDLVLSRGLTAAFQPEWKKGFAYIYNVTIDPSDLQLSEIKFNVSTSITDWGDGGEIDEEE
ncbi:MAG: fimbrillin family protein [Muribaculaceae bacterium]|nr:fimbrillin family protein [Muribaculaceae bacterium]